MLIQEAIRKAEAVNGGIMNKAAKVNGVYYSPIGNFDSFLIVPIGQTIPKPGKVKTWSPCTTELLGEDWEVYETDKRQEMTSDEELREILMQAKTFIKDSLDMISLELDLLKEIEIEIKRR